MESEDFYAAADSPSPGDLPERFTALAAANYLESDTPAIEQLLPRLRRRRLGRNLMNAGVTLATVFAITGLVQTASQLDQGESANPAERGAAGLAGSLVCGQAFPAATEAARFAPVSAKIDADNRWTAFVPALVEQEWTHEVEVDGSLSSVAPQGTEIYLLDRDSRVLGYSTPFLNADDSGSITVIAGDAVRVSAPLAGEFELCSPFQSELANVPLADDAQPGAFQIGVIQHGSAAASQSSAAVLAPAPLLFSPEVSISTDYARFAHVPGSHDAVAEITIQERAHIEELKLLSEEKERAVTQYRLLLFQDLTEGLEP